MPQTSVKSAGLLAIWVSVTSLLTMLISTHSLASTFSTATERKCALTLTGEEAPPYHSDGMENQGVMAEVVTAAFHASNCSVSLTLQNWARAITDAKQGVQDVLIGAAWSEDRHLTFLYSTPYYSRPVVLLKKRATIARWSKLSDLQPHSFAIVRNSFFTGALNTLNNSSIVKVPDEMSVIRLVLNDRVTFGVTEERVARALIAQHFPKDGHTLDFAQKPLATNDTHLIVSRKHPLGAMIINAFNQGLATIKANGLYNRILSKHQIPIN